MKRVTDLSEHGSEPATKPLKHLVTFAIVNYNGERVLGRTLGGLHALNTGCRVIVVDDGSTDDSSSLVRTGFPTVELIEFGTNNGVSHARRRAVKEGRTPYLMLMDNDVTFAPDCIQRLLEQLLQYPNALSCRPRLVHADRPDVIYQDASSMHYLAVSANQLRDRPTSEGLNPFPRQTLGGGIVLLNCAIARKLGNFDENYLFGWGDDAELDVRGRLCGFLTLQNPYAISYHVQRPSGLGRVTGQLYNRRRLILICYSTRSLVLLAIPLIAFELLTLMCLAGGYRSQYAESWRLLRATFTDIRRRRKQLQLMRTRGDRVFINGGRISITGRLGGSRFLLALAPVLSWCFATYWALVRPFISDGYDNMPQPLDGQRNSRLG